MNRTRRTLCVTAATAKLLQDAFGTTPGFQDMFNPCYVDDLGVDHCIASGVFTDHQLSIIDKVLAKAEIATQIKLGAVKCHDGENCHEKMKEWGLSAKPMEPRSKR